MTPTREELEGAILSDPGDSEAYRVYGDWLEGQGDPRGELISLALKIDEGGGSDGALMQLRDAHLRRNKGLQPQLGMWNAHYRWRWGFIEEVELDDPSVADLELVLDHPACLPLRRLQIVAGGDAMPALLDAIEQTRPTIEELVIDADRPGRGLRARPDLWARLPRLRALVLEGDGLLDVVDHPTLAELRLTGAPLCAERWNLPSLGHLSWRHLGQLSHLDPACHSVLPALSHVTLDGQIEQGLLGHAPFLGLWSRVDRCDVDLT